MSQRKTIVPELEPDGGNYVDPQISVNDDFYAREARTPKGTIVPEMQEQHVSVHKNEQGPVRPVNFYKGSGKPIVGFLYSVSRTPLGEFWPLQMGRNTIGQSSDCDICLQEGTVSSSHAVIVTRQIKNGMIAAITDAQSTNGTKINGETIGFAPEECHDGDIITIGNHYEMLLILIDSAKRGLSKSKDFIPVEVGLPANEDYLEDPVIGNGGSSPAVNDHYRKTAIDLENEGFYSSSKGTMGFDGNGDSHGGTVAM